MEYQTLYRKYRPKNFNEVVGQKVTIQILKNALSKNKLSHAYLFYGPRGTGKTSIAKILSRTINCENHEDGIPCEKCSSCLASINPGCVDIIEIDAASNNGVDEIRELKNNVTFVPSELKYKVYIVDEVHMLSSSAFNALLKTLEEPPAHAIFILATTEFQKVPLTIVSRCQTLEFKKIDDISMTQKLNEISLKENIKIDDSGLKEICKYSNGGLRDAIGILEKAIAYTDDTITENTIKEISGNISDSELEKFTKLFDDKDIEGIVQKISDYYNEGIDLIKLSNNLIDYNRNKMINTKKYSTKTCSLLIELDKMVSNMEKSENPKTLLEATIINFLIDKNEDNTINNATKTKNDNQINNESIKQNQEDHKPLEEKPVSIEIKDDLIEIRVNNTLCNPQKNIISEIRNNWEKMKDYGFDDEVGNIARLLSSDVVPVAASDTNVVLTSKMGGIATQINTELDTVEKIFYKIFNKKYKVICLSESTWKKYTEEYRENKSKFTYIEEKINEKKNKTLKEKARELFDE